MTAPGFDRPKAFTSYDVQMSLFDSARVDLFRRAIAEVVRPGDVVVDAGSGTGVLGLLAASAGAARVYCIEQSPEYVSVIRENARRNGFGDRVVVLQADATAVWLPEEVDVIVCEVLSAGLLCEPQVQILNHLRQFLRAGGSIIPRAVDNYVDLVDAQSRVYGLRFDYEPRWKILDDVPLTETTAYLRSDFHAGQSPEIAAEVQASGVLEGTANAVRITYTIHFTDTIASSTPSAFLLNPQIIFLAEPVKIAIGGDYVIRLRYQAAGNPMTCRIQVSPG